MADVLSKKQRSYCMSQIKSTDTQAEIRLRKELWHRGLRYRLHTRLPGRPDIVFPSRQVAVFVDGCFWHRCPDCFVKPKTNADFWKNKLSANVERDRRNDQRLESSGWVVLRIWEHDVRKDASACADAIAHALLEAEA